MKKTFIQIAACLGIIAMQFIIDTHIPLVISSALPFIAIFFISIEADWRIQLRYIILYTGLLNIFVSIPWGVLPLIGLIVTYCAQWLRVQLTSGQSIGAFLFIIFGSYIVWTASLILYTGTRAAFGGVNTLPSVSTLLTHTFGQGLFVLALIFSALAIQRRLEQLTWTDLFAMLYERSVRPV